MKKLLLALLLCLPSTMLFAQDYAYSIDETGVSGTHYVITGVLAIDGVEVFNGEGMQNEGGANIEIGVFDQDGNCRAAKFPTWRSKSNQYIYQLKIRGDQGFTYPVFKVYNHNNDTEMAVEFSNIVTFDGGTTYEEISYFLGGATLGKSTTPVTINFVSVGGQEFPKDINGYGEDETGKAGYYFIASPIGGVNPTEVTNMTYPQDGDDYALFDLFAFNENMTNEEWRNYKLENFVLESGMGYLYANKADVQLVVTGTPTEEETVDVILQKTGSGAWAGWNLVGNPFGVNAFISKPGYIMEGEGYVVKNANDPIDVWQGILVQASEDGEVLTFTRGGSKSSNLVLNITDGNNLVDGASICFGEGENLSKITFRDNDSKLYLTQENKDYAVVYSEAQGEMPVSFKAEKSGTYNLSFNAENVDFNYLHLIDNMTGNDVDLLKTQSYSFDAQANQSNRFKLVFSANNNGTDNFAFINDGNLFIPNIEGEAVLQVIDVTGRVLSTETVSGSYTKAINAAQGVYVLRLINGINTLTQKIVVK